MNVSRNSFMSRTRQSSASSIMSSRKSVGNLNRKGSHSGRYSVSGRSNQSLQVIARSEYNIVESFGHPLPVMINEALTFSERNTNVTVNYSDNGTAWAVHGRRLLIWYYKEAKSGSSQSSADHVRTPQRRAASASQCRELTLPHCDIGHKACLITVFFPEGQQMAACLAVSPTGDVRYWPSIAHDGSSVDTTGILEGQEFDSLLSILPQGYLLATTTCNLVLVQLRINKGRHTIQHKTIRAPSGFFGGIGKKFASILIGMNSGHEKEHKFLKVYGEQFGHNEGWLVTLLADRWIQIWKFFPNGVEQFIFEDVDFMRKIREAFHQKFWNLRDINDVEVTLLDMETVDSKIYILAGAVNNYHAPQMFYSIAIFGQGTDSLKLISFLALKLNMFYTIGSESECLKLRFILNGGIAYLYSDRSIYPVNFSNAALNTDLDVEKIEFQQIDKIMNATICSHIPLFFTKSHGLVSISPSDFDPSDFMNSSFSPDVFSTSHMSESINHTIISQQNLTGAGNLTMYQLDPDEIFNSNKDATGRLKAAFIYHLKKNTAMSNAILKELTSNLEQNSEVDRELDKIVITISQDLAEDIPASDPRWELQEEDRHALGSSASLQIVQQLRDKNRALTHFIEFLLSTGLWEKLNAVTYRGSLKSTAQILSDINEKIIAGIALQSLPNSFGKILDEAIHSVISARNAIPTGNLTCQDLFYVKITRMQEIFFALSEMCEKYVEQHNSLSYLPGRICDINTITLDVLEKVSKYRERNSDLYALPIDKQNIFEYLPWTALSGKGGLREALLQMISNTLKCGSRVTGEPELRQKLYQQMMDLIDFVLDGRKKYLESIRDNEKYGVLAQQYQAQRSDLIYPLIEDEQYELAVKLAEKYLDFQSLVVICDQTQNQKRLDEYIERYKEYDFSQFAINWHLRQNKQGDLFVRFKSNQAALARFLGDHPSLAWIQLIFNGELDRGSKILLGLALDETSLLERKKTMLSLAKLSALASDSDLCIQIAEINSELRLIDYQEQISLNLLELFGYDVNNQKVLKAEEIINLFICEENPQPNELDFRKALEIHNHAEDPVEVKHKIWCAAILKDSWIDIDMTRALDKLKDTLFFRLVDLCITLDEDVKEYLAPIEELLESPELGELISNKSFQYLLKLGYEDIEQHYYKN